MAVVLPTAQKVHNDVRAVGNTGRNGTGMDLGEFLDTRGSLAKSRSTARSDPSDPASPTHPWLPFNADWCSVPSSGTLDLIQRIINALSGENLDYAQYIAQEADFNGVTVPFYYGCLRHDFNWRNLHRVKHHLKHDTGGVWTSTVRQEADERFRQDLIVLCKANRYGEPEVSARFDWTLTMDDVETCEEVALEFKFGVSTVLFRSIRYNH